LLDTPDAKIVCSTHYDDLLHEMDMIVTSTSGAGKKVLDITKVKPGCVITDVARPLDLPPEEVAKRPDVLVIESGEIELPTKVKGLKSIGLPPNVIYACLAETIVLALEGRFEVFTIGRDTEWEKVKEIYKLGIKHGMKLSAISGVKGVYSDADIAKVVTLAKKARLTWDRDAAAAAPNDKAPRKAAKKAVAKVAPAVRKAPVGRAAQPATKPDIKPAAKAATKPATTPATTPAIKTIAAKARPKKAASVAAVKKVAAKTTALKEAAVEKTAVKKAAPQAARKKAAASA